MTDIAAAAIQDLAPTGVVRAAINTGNPVLARKGLEGGEPSGVSVEIAREMGRRLGRPVQLIAYETAGNVMEALARGECDVAFLADEPARTDRVVFSAPYVVIEGTYMVWQDADFASASQLDQDGIRIAVGQNAAYDLHLTRALKAAQIVRAPSPSAGIVRITAKHRHWMKKVERLCGTELAPLGEGGSTVQLEIFAAVEMALLIEMIVYG